MPTITQAKRPMAVTTPLGVDKLLLIDFAGEEAISQLFEFKLDLLAEVKTDVPFDKLLGQPVGVRLDLPGDKQRFFHGVCVRISQGASDERFTSYQMEIVPAFWLWSKRVQSRIFQHKSVPEILAEVLKGLDVSFDIHGTFHPRDYCVQYRESDFAFASRLMEEEGIYYYFKHSAAGHQLVVANTPKGHPDVPGKTEIVYTSLPKGTVAGDDLISQFGKTQELTPGKYTLWDHSFELPHKHLEAEKAVPDSVKVGQVTHKLAVGDNGKLEVYDYPGAYAQRFDGIDAGGGAKAADLQQIFEDNKRTVEVRAKQGTLPAILIRGAGSARQMTSGHKFTLATQAGDTTKLLKAEGAYVLTAVKHAFHLSGNYQSGDWESFEYDNTFECIPADFPFAPPQDTPKPTVAGSQTAVVVGPPGEEIFTDKYSRVKVQFHWDRQGKNDAGSSCWVRVATHWAGKQWGLIHIPRIGQEVVVDFLEGDPDQPIIVGSVYNAEMMPPYGLPANKTMSGIKTRSSLGGSPETFNEICFEDKKGAELLYIRAEKDQTIGVENDESHWVGHDRLKTVDNDETVLVHHDRTETVDNNETITVHGNRTETVDKNETITIHQNRKETVDQNETIDIGANRTETVGGAESITVMKTRDRKVVLAETVMIGAAQTIMVAAVRTVNVIGAQVTTVGASHSVTVVGGQSVTVGGSQTVKVSGNITETVGGNYTEKIDKSKKEEVKEDYAAEIGKHLSFSAGEQIVLKTGDASITMKKDGTIEIKGKDIKIDGSGKIVAKASSDMVLKGSKIAQN